MLKNWKMIFVSISATLVKSHKEPPIRRSTSTARKFPFRFKASLGLDLLVERKHDIIGQEKEIFSQALPFHAKPTLAQWVHFRLHLYLVIGHPSRGQVSSTVRSIELVSHAAFQYIYYRKKSKATDRRELKRIYGKSSKQHYVRNDMDPEIHHPSSSRTNTYFQTNKPTVEP